MPAWLPLPYLPMFQIDRNSSFGRQYKIEQNFKLPTIYKVIWSKAGGREGTEALLTDFNGSNDQIDWSNDIDASAYGLCSFIFEDEIYFLGQVFFN